MEPDLSSEHLIKMTGCHRLDVGIRSLCLEIVPGKKTIQCIEIFLLRNKVIKPYLLDFLEKETEANA